jgi:hypothetical protein
MQSAHDACVAITSGDISIKGPADRQPESECHIESVCDVLLPPHLALFLPSLPPASAAAILLGCRDCRILHNTTNERTDGRHE